MSDLLKKLDLHILSILQLDPIPQGKTESYFLNVGKKFVKYGRTDTGFFETAKYGGSEARHSFLLQSINPKVEWFVTRHAEGKIATQAMPDRGPKHKYWCSYKFSKPGVYMIWCRLTVGNAEKPLTIATTDTVVSTQVIHRKQLARQKGKLENPGVTRSNITREMKALESIWNYSVEAFPDKFSANALNKHFQDYYKRIVHLGSQAGALDKLLDASPSDGKKPVPFPASLLHPLRASWVSTSRKGKHFAPRLAYAVDLAGHVVLFHWTNPEASGLHGRYVGKKGTFQQKLASAIEEFQNECGFPKGHLVIEVPGDSRNKISAKSFSTDTPRFKGFWSETLEGIERLMGAVAMGASVAMLLTLPIPGSRIASAALFTAMMSSGVEAVAKLSRRHRRGRRDLRGDAIDVLTLASTLFYVGGRWAQAIRKGDFKLGAKLVSSEFAQDLAFVGRVADDAVLGVLLIPDQVEEFNAILNDPDMGVVERLGRLARLAADSTLLPVAFNDVRKRAKMSSSGLGVKGKTLTLRSNKTPDMVGQKSQGSMKVQVHEGRRTLPSGKKPWGKGGKSPTAKAPKERAMTKDIDGVFQTVAKKEKKIILVIDTNASALNWMQKGKVEIGGTTYRLEAKPMEVKGNSLRNGDYAGIAAAKPGDSLGAGFRTINDPPHLVVRDKPPPPTMFFSDYDLHGVYDAGTGKSAWTEDWQTLTNAKLKKSGDTQADMLLHPPRDLWNKRLDPKAAGKNYGPIGHMKDGSVTAYTPDGTFRLENVGDLEKFYRDHGLDWDNIWKEPTGGWRKGK